MKEHSERIIWILFGLMFILLLRTAWVSEDAYITLRTVDNFVTGHGLTWNISERVQAFTHPLWMLLLSLIYFFTQEGFYTTIGLSVAFSMAAFLVIIWMMPRRTFATYAGISVLFFSKAYVDFSTSGLENPATHFLLACFLWFFLHKEDELNHKKIFSLSIIAGLATLNRMDTILFFIPPLLLILWEKKSWRALQTVLLGFSPFILWEIFSIIYYGFPFPNTAYAKLNTGLARIDLLEMGYLYFINSIHWDPITLLVIFIAGGTSLHSGNLREKIVALGIFFYLFYVLWIGADFMSGRFFSGALLMAVVLFNRLFANLPLSGGVFVLLFFILFGMTSPTPTLTSIDDDSYSTGRVSVTQISDERSFYFQPSGLLYDKRNVASPFHHWVFRGMQMRQDGQRVSIQYNVGYMGYFAGRTTHIIDRLALTDPLLARMTPLDAKNAKPGHYEREIPEGYFKSVRDNQNRIEDDALAEYYEKIRIITRGSMRDLERLVIIWKMNTGQYDYLLRDYESRTSP